MAKVGFMLHGVMGPVKSKHKVVFNSAAGEAMNARKAWDPGNEASARPHRKRLDTCREVTERRCVQVHVVCA